MNILFKNINYVNTYIQKQKIKAGLGREAQVGKNARCVVLHVVMGVYQAKNKSGSGPPGPGGKERLLCRSSRCDEHIVVFNVYFIKLNFAII
jgi:hypothetical protein